MENHIQQQVNTVALLYLFLPCVELSSTTRASVKCHKVVKRCSQPDFNLHIINAVNAHVWKLFRFVTPENFYKQEMTVSELHFIQTWASKGTITSGLEWVRSFDVYILDPLTVKNITLRKSQHGYFCDCHERAIGQLNYHCDLKSVDIRWSKFSSDFKACEADKLFENWENIMFLRGLYIKSHATRQKTKPKVWWISIISAFLPTVFITMQMHVFYSWRNWHLSEIRQAIILT